MAVGTVQSSGGGGYETATKQTQTGDAETQLQEIELPDEDGWHNVIARVSAQANDGTTEYAAIKRIEKNFRVENGAIVPADTVDHSPSSPFDEVGGLFSASGMVLRDAGNGNAELAGSSPGAAQKETVETTRDQSTITNIVNTDAGRSGVDTDPADGSIHYCYDDGTSLKYVAPDGTIEEVDSSRPVDQRGNVDLTIDENGIPHAVWSRRSDNFLVYSSRSGGSWSAPEIIDNSGNVIERSSIDTSGGSPFVAYRDQTNLDLYYADNQSGSWSTENVGNSGAMCVIKAKSATDIGIAFYNSSGSASVGFLYGESGSFSSTEISTEAFNALALAPSGDDWVISWSRSNDNNLRFSKGNPNDGFTNTTVSTGTFDYSFSESIRVFSGGQYDVIIAEGDSAGSNPYDAILFTNEGGSWSQDSVIETFGDTWTSHLNENYITITDNGTGDSKLASIRLEDMVSATINWRTKALQ